jgi:hypothetical protein
MKQKPNVIFWTLVLVGAVSVFLFIYSLVVQMSQDTPLFARHNLSEELLMISCLLNFVLIFLRFGHKKQELFGPWKDPEAQGKSSMKSGTF